MRLDQQPWLPVFLAVVAAAVLLAGILTRSETPSPVSEISITAAELKGVRELAESNSLSAFRDRLNHVAEQMEPVLAWSDRWQRAGVMWRTGEVLIARDLLDPERTTRLLMGKETADAKPLQWAPGLPFANVGFNATSANAPAHAKLDNLRAGTSLVGLSLRGRQRLLLPMTLVGMVDGDCNGWRVQRVHVSQMLTDDFVGAGVFTLQGELVGTVADCNEGRWVLTLDSIGRVLDQLRTAQGQVLSAYGMLISPLSAPAAAHFQQQEGLLVDTVWQQWPAAQAGLMPGDLLLSVGDRKLVTAGALMDQQGALDEGAMLTYRRGGVQRRVRLPRTTGTRPMVVMKAEQSAVVEKIERGSRGFHAGLRAGDEWLQAYGPGGKPVNLHGAPSLTEAMYIVFRRGDSLRGVLLTP